MANENDQGKRTSTDPVAEGADREASPAQRIEQRRQNDKEISRREDEGYDQPQSSAQKEPNPGPRP